MNTTTTIEPSAIRVRIPAQVPGPGSHFPLPPVPSHVLASDDAQVLGRIAERGVSLCIWKRRPDARATPAIQALLSAPRTPNLEADMPHDHDLAAGLLACAFREDPGVPEAAQFLARDIVALAGRFRDISGTLHPHVHLTRVEDDGCALFHVDTLRVRMLCTYAGAGTQWLENDNVRRDQLGSQGRTLREATDAIVIDAARIQTLPAWHVAVLKGRTWPGEETNAIVHRSPPVPDIASRRIVLCIDISTTCSC